MSAERALLVITDPVARAVDGESVRVALDVLKASAPVRMCIPTDESDLERALRRRGRRRVVVIAGDCGIHDVVRMLGRYDDLAGTPLGIVPIGAPAPGQPSLATALGLPAEPAKAARIALGGRQRPMDLLLDELGDVALRSVRIGPSVRNGAPRPPLDDRTGGGGGNLVRRTWESLGTALGAALTPLGRPGRRQQGQRLHIEADGTVLSDVDRPVLSVRVGCYSQAADRTGLLPGGTATVAITHAHDLGAEVHAREVTVRGRAFSYTADGRAVGPVQSRTWTVQTAGWQIYG